MATSSELLSYLKKKNLSQKAIGNIMGQYEAEGKHGNEENLNWNAKNLLMNYGDPGYTFTFRGKSYTVPSHRNKVRFKTLDAAQTTASQGAEAVGNVLYGGRMGNAADEGYKYRGRGAIQITGKNNYKALGEEFFLEGLVDDPNVFIDNPDLVNDSKFADKVPYHYFTGVKKVDPAKLDDPAIVHRAVGPSTGGVGSKEYLKRKEEGEKWSSIVSNTEALGDWNETNPIFPSERTTYAQTDPRRVDLAQPTPQQPVPYTPSAPMSDFEQPQYATMEDLLADRGLMGTRGL